MSVEKYYKMNGTSNELEILSPPIDVGGGELRIHPTAEQWAEHVAYPKKKYDTAPEAPSGTRAVPSGWEMHDGEWRRTWRFEIIPGPTIEDYDAAMENHLRSEREDRGYTTREPDSYLTSHVPRWAQDARDWVSHRDDVMEYALGMINEVKSGQRDPPTMEEFVDGLPSIVWTYAEE